MIDHLGFSVSDFARSREFYLRALEPLGVGLVMEVTAEQTGAGAHAGFGRDGRAVFWIGDGGQPGPVHIAITAESREQVHAFHAAALAAGGADNGAPGPRPHYSPDYYAAFVLDPDGYNIEAVTRAPE